MVGICMFTFDNIYFRCIFKRMSRNPVSVSFILHMGTKQDLVPRATEHSLNLQDVPETI